MNKLGEAEFLQTFKAPMLDVSALAEPKLDIWPYVDAVPAVDLEGYELSDGIVKHVYRSSNEQFEHVLISTETADVFFVIVVDVAQLKIYGHHLLNLPKLYQ